MGAYNESGEPEAAREGFRRAFGGDPVRAVRAPGRVNWIGEHTDYQEGLVLPCAIDRDTVVLAAPRDGDRVVVVSENEGEARFDPRALRPQKGWIDYVQGVVWALAERGVRLRGASLWIGSRVPTDSGLSSSAALGVGVAFAFDRLLGLGLSARALAELAHRGESGFVGVGCGILDPFASALGRVGCVLRIDCRDRSVRAIPIAAEPGGVAILVAHSGARRRLASGGYGERVEECRAAFAALQRAGVLPPGARALRDLAIDRLPAAREALGPRLARRVRHVATENVRVEAVVASIRRGDLVSVGALLREGQASLRDDFEVSLPEIDLLCELADAQPGCFGSRLTGAGFGGCTIHLVRPEAASEVAEAIGEGFARRFGRRPPIRAVRPAAGAGDLALASA